MKYTRSQLSLLVILRLLIGWHFLYEGIAKLLNPNWSSMGYLMDSQGWFAGLFKWMASTEGLMNTVDFLNQWGLIAIGLGLILGLLSRQAIIGGIILLAFYYLSHPASIGAQYAMPTEGNYLWVNKTLIELFTLCVLLVFPTSKHFGFDALIFKK